MSSSIGNIINQRRGRGVSKGFYLDSTACLFMCSLEKKSALLLKSYLSLSPQRVLV